MSFLPIKLSLHSSKTSPTTLMAQKFQEEVEKSNTRLKVEISMGGIQGKALADLAEGLIDMATISLSDLGKPFSVLHRPYLFTNLNDVKEIFGGEFGQKFRQLVLEKHKVQIIGPFYIGTRHIGTTGDVIKTPEDLKGEPFRMPEGKAWEHFGKSLGADHIASVSIHGLTNALQEGMITRLDNPLSALKSYQLQGINQVNLTAHFVDILFCTISERKWKELEESEQSVIVKSFETARIFNDTSRQAEEAALLEDFTEAGMISKPDLTLFQEHSEKYYQESVDSDLTQEELEFLQLFKSAASAANTLL